ncbi:MAG: DnaD domain protein [Chloroflexota bacterium]|nr:DnaD domain protein [Chloroflexota bacterium]
MTTFAGFAPGVPRTIKLPAAFITDLLPLIDDLAELKVTLFAFYAVQQREGQFRYLTRADFGGDVGLIAGLRAVAPNADIEITLDTALAAACVRGALLRAVVRADYRPEATLYFINAEPGRRALAQIAAGAWYPGDALPVEILPERPNVFQLYEENIGALTPLIVEALKDAERDYPPGWIEDAIRVAAEKNARHWRFIEAVLARRSKEGHRYDETNQKTAAVNGRAARASDFYVSIFDS